MKQTALIMAASAIVLTLIGCATFPSEQLGLNLQDEVVPVMLSPVPGTAETRTFEFKAGYSEISVSSTSTEGDATASVTVTESHNVNESLAKQMANLFVQYPRWIAVKRLYLVSERSITGFSGSTDSIDYTLFIAIACPIEGAK